ncbi:HupE/UreJ family protein [Rhodobium gokarnense]|uniref:Urease accessory protein n=1 Tax=Rhodobium gokarnense TaxID=364296 RepID=A0ABT3H796_9HYPH|nr:HupE/UreJ family protein [Rhodobium gokarnense]MCW2306263.1 urease accessory protein [Rhodobium gokarnense]
MNRSLLPLSLLLTAVASPALAHTGVGGGSGFATGFGHPLGGLDHILAMVAVGFLAAQMGGRMLWALPLAFLGMMVVGGAAGMAGIGVPFVELGIVGSIIVFGAVIAFGRSLPLGAAVVLVGAFAIFHGHAHGTEMPADASGLAYGAGFLLATAILHAIGIGIGVAAQMTSAAFGKTAVRAGGGAIALAGVALLVL